MTTSPIDLRPPRAQAVQITEDLLIVELLDARILSVPLAWFPGSWREPLPNGPTGDWLDGARAFTGSTSTRISVLQACLQATLPPRVSSR